jgi:hypothetical protein
LSLASVASAGPKEDVAAAASTSVSAMSGLGDNNAVTAIGPAVDPMRAPACDATFMIRGVVLIRT